MLSLTGKALITFGHYNPKLYDSVSALHVGYRQDDTSNTEYDLDITQGFSMHVPFGSLDSEQALLAMDENPALQGYLSVLFLVINCMCDQMPSGLFNTAMYDP